MYKLFLFLLCSFLFSFIVQSHQYRDDVDSRCYLYRINSLKQINMEILEKMYVGYTGDQKEKEIVECIEDNIDIYALIFFYKDEKCSCCLTMREMLVDFMLKYEKSFVYAIPFSGCLSPYKEFYSFDIEINDPNVMEWAKPLPSLLLYDFISDDVIFISNSCISIQELEQRLVNYIMWADKVEDNIFTKMDFLDMLYGLSIDYNDFSYIVLCKESKIKNTHEVVPIEH